MNDPYRPVDPQPASELPGDPLPPIVKLGWRENVRNSVWPLLAFFAGLLAVAIVTDALGVTETIGDIARKLGWKGFLYLLVFLGALAFWVHRRNSALFAVNEAAWKSYGDAWEGLYRKEQDGRRRNQQLFDETLERSGREYRAELQRRDDELAALKERLDREDAADLERKKNLRAYLMELRALAEDLPSTVHRRRYPEGQMRARLVDLPEVPEELAQPGHDFARLRTLIRTANTLISDIRDGVDPEPFTLDPGSGRLGEIHDELAEAALLKASILGECDMLYDIQGLHGLLDGPADE